MVQNRGVRHSLFQFIERLLAPIGPDKGSVFLSQGIERLCHLKVPFNKTMIGVAKPEEGSNLLGVGEAAILQSLVSFQGPGSLKGPK